MKKMLILCVSLLATSVLLGGCGKGGEDSSPLTESTYSSSEMAGESSSVESNDSSIKTSEESSSETSNTSSEEASSDSSSENAEWEVDSSEKWTSNH